MRITGFTSLSTSHDHGRPIGDANGHYPSGIRPVAILVLHTDAGVDGIAIGNHADIARLFPLIEGQGPDGVMALHDRMRDAVFKSGVAGSLAATIGTIDYALWDLKAKQAGQPLWRLLGGQDRFVPGYASGICLPLNEAGVAALYGAFADHGFAAAKLKGGRDVAADIARLVLVRDVLARNTASPALMLDANECWHVSQAIRHVRAIEAAIDLTWIEEPVGRFDAAGLRKVGDGIAAAVASGENLTDPRHFAPLIAGGAIDVVQCGAAWGITMALRVGHLAHGFSLPVSPVGSHWQVAHAMAALPNHLAIEIQTLTVPAGVAFDGVVGDGGIVLGDAPGLGITLAPEAFVAAQPEAPGVAGPDVRPPRAGLRMTPDDE